MQKTTRIKNTHISQVYLGFELQIFLPLLCNFVCKRLQRTVCQQNENKNVDK